MPYVPGFVACGQGKAIEISRTCLAWANTALLVEEEVSPQPLGQREKEALQRYRVLTRRAEISSPGTAHCAD
eukprot:CAMPEP_0174368830 /NCGR_PEP_ID=MMETSP0811_2-20130205/90371_1 /TAXON_ID=73025 ORGANISM="Eutreptiella gymnastica-like, Strain CCMP1594" /NCGR_SAMPLE_ID=MMETSP0811_2 /ASSEMBLY_ACC=CAM_ASM_000667 /LENGTH=71 /DNA_ID=CAMNT_0015512665 /DNA_START=147 /DNA_END=359 /DNA_ORIENTATION=+